MFPSCSAAIISSSLESARINVSDKYQVTGTAKKDGENFSVVINGRIINKGESLDGMNLISILSNIILLEKDGVKYKINYNQAST